MSCFIPWSFRLTGRFRQPAVLYGVTCWTAKAGNVFHFFIRILCGTETLSAILSAGILFSIMPFDNFESDVEYEERVFKPWRLFIMDSGEIIEKLAEVTVSTKKEYFALDGKFRKTARDFLDEHYPEWEDVNAY